MWIHKVVNADDADHPKNSKTFYWRLSNECSRRYVEVRKYPHGCYSDTEIPSTRNL